MMADEELLAQRRRDAGKADTAPTRLTCDPELVRTNLPTGGRPSWIYTCDNGRVYSCEQLAAVTGICRKQIIVRLEKYGWASHKVLQSKEEARAERMAATKLRQDLDPLVALGGNEEWKGLAGRDRKGNLASIRPPGTWELQEVDRV